MRKLCPGLPKMAAILLSGLLPAGLLLASLAVGCNVPSPVKPAGKLVAIADSPLPLASSPAIVRVPQTGGDTRGNFGVTVDISNASQGYTMISYTGGAGKVKVQITRDTTYTYNLRSDGVYEVFPFSSGSGSYTVNVFEHVTGNSYALAFGTTVDVQLQASTLPFLYPSQYVNFDKDSKIVLKGQELADGAQNKLEIVDRVYNYVVNNITYDFDKAASVQSGYLPDVDQILASGKGICFDYAAVMAAMLRTQEIPTRLEIGYVSGGVYHAWISVYIDEIGWINNIIQFDGKTWKLMDPTFASSGKQSGEIMKFIGNSSNYSTQYRY